MDTFPHVRLQESLRHVAGARGIPLRSPVSNRHRRLLLLRSLRPRRGSGAVSFLHRCRLSLSFSPRGLPLPLTSSHFCSFKYCSPLRKPDVARTASPRDAFILAQEALGA